MKPLLPSALLYPFVGSVLLLVGINRSQAAVFNVPNGDVTGLKNAMNAANTNGQDDTIELATNGTYVLTTIDNAFYDYNGLPRVGIDGGKKLTIHGNGSTIQRDPAGTTPAFRILYLANGANVGISDLALSNGRAEDGSGGGIDNDGATLVVNNCVFTANLGHYGGGGIMSDGSTTSAVVTVSKCVFTGNLAPNSFGGAIINFGPSGSAKLTVTDCTFNGNSASYGGGVVNYNDSVGSATSTVSNSVFTGNSAGFGRGGAIYNTTSGGPATLNVSNCTINGGNSANFYGGGISNNGNAQISNCTVDGNSAERGGGISNEGGILQISNCTISGNSASFSGGGIYNDGTSTTTVTVSNSTLSANLSGSTDPSWSGTVVNNNAPKLELANVILSTAPSGKTISNAGGIVISHGHNLSSDNGSGFLTAAGDQMNTDPKLDPAGLQNNGGPTQTIALLSNSPAINAGDDENAPTRDQRSYTRNGVSDIGAFEYQGRLMPLTAVSRKNHAGTDFDLNLPLTGANVGVECRRNTGADSSGPNAGRDHQVLVTFPYPVAIDSASGDHSVTADALPSGFNQVYRINLHNVPNAQLITLSLNNVRDNTNSFTDTIPMGVLLGDVNQDSFVLSGDYTAVRQRSGATADATNFQFDINVDGFILSGDYTTVRQLSGSHLSANPALSPKLRLRGW